MTELGHDLETKWDSDLEGYWGITKGHTVKMAALTLYSALHVYMNEYLGVFSEFDCDGGLHPNVSNLFRLHPDDSRLVFRNSD